MTDSSTAFDRADALVARVLIFLSSEKRGAAVDSLSAQRDLPRGGKPTIVVAGEDKRGKSTLVNALLAAPDLSPVGVKVVTGVPVRFVHAREPFAKIYRYGTQDPDDVTVDIARSFATVDGNPGNEQNVESITIGLELAALEFMDIFDTPGVGGLSSGHAELTLQSLHSADALLFVVDAAAPMSASELAFLRRASARLQAVVLVVTKTDVHAGWRQILQDDLAILAEQAPRFAGCSSAGVSSVAALRALSLDDPEFAAEIRVESGIGGLADLLRTEIAAAVDRVRMQNLLRAAISRLAVVERDLAERRDASAPDGSGIAGLDAQVAALARLRQDRMEWQNRLDVDIRKLTVTRQDICARRTIEMRHRYEQRARTAKSAELESMPGELLAELSALASELNEFAAQRLAEITSAVLDELDAQVSVRSSIDEIGGTQLSGTAMPVASSARPLGHGERMELISELGRGRSLLSLASGSSALAFLAPPFGIILGMGLGGLFAFTSWRAHTRSGQSADFRVWLDQQIANAQLSIRNGFALQIVDLQSEIRSLVRRVLADREQALQATIEEARTLQRTDARTRDKLQNELEQRVKNARRLRIECATALRTSGVEQ